MPALCRCCSAVISIHWKNLDIASGWIMRASGLIWTGLDGIVCVFFHLPLGADYTIRTGHLLPFHEGQQHPCWSGKEWSCWEKLYRDTYVQKYARNNNLYNPRRILYACPGPLLDNYTWIDRVHRVGFLTGRDGCGVTWRAAVYLYWYQGIPAISDTTTNNSGLNLFLKSIDRQSIFSGGCCPSLHCQSGKSVWKWSIIYERDYYI